MVPNPSFAANNKVYDGTTAATVTSNSVLLNGVLAVDVGNVNVTMSGYTANFTTANVGTGIPVLLNGLTLTGPAAGNYMLSQPVVLSANITPATLTVSAVNQSKTYGLPNPPLAVNYNGFVGSDGTNVLTGAPSVSTTATTNSLPGAYPIVVSAGTLSAANYIFTFVNGTLTVVALPQLNSAVLSRQPDYPFAGQQSRDRTYQLEYKDNLTAPAWTLVFGPVPGTGNSIIVTNNFGASPQRFFRVGHQSIKQAVGSGRVAEGNYSSSCKSTFLSISRRAHWSNAGTRWRFKETNRQYTFGEIERFAKNLAALILKRKDMIRQPLPVFLPKSAENIVADIGILYSGNAYANLDIKSPPQRLKGMLENLDPIIIITSQAQAAALRALGNSGGKTAVSGGSDGARIHL